MQPNLSHHERLVSVAMGTALLSYGLFGKKWSIRILEQSTGLMMVLRGLSGYCPLYRAFHRRPLHAPHDIERSIIINRSVEEVRSLLDEGDPLLHESSRKMFPITAGYLLWNIEMEPIGDECMTRVRASLSERNESFELRTYQSRSVLRSLADVELQRMKRLIEEDGHSEFRTY